MIFWEEIAKLDEPCTGLVVDPESTPVIIKLFVASYGGTSSLYPCRAPLSLMLAEKPNSGKVSKLASDPADRSKFNLTPTILGLPRAMVNRATNTLQWGKDGKIYIAQVRISIVPHLSS